MNGGWAVDIEHGSIRYLTPSDEVAQDHLPDGYNRVDDIMFRDHPRMRRVLVPLTPAATRYIFNFLHWTDGTSLTELDQAITEGAPSYDSFAGAIVVDLRAVTCRSCDSILRIASPDTGNFVNTPERLRSHGYCAECTICGLPIGLLVAEYLEVD